MPAHSDSVQEFRAKLTGQVLMSGDAEYDSARSVWNGAIDRKPALIARCHSAADVAEAIRYARTHGLEIAIRAFAGHRVRVQFWDDGSMWLLAEEEWPAPIEADCDGVISVIDDGHLQAFLMLRKPINVRTGGPSKSSFLVERAGTAAQLAPLAELYEIASIP